MALGEDNARGLSVGVGIAVTDVENNVWAVVDSSTIDSAQGVSVTATENMPTVNTLSIGGAVAVNGGAVAGAASVNIVKNDVEAYVVGPGGTITFSSPHHLNTGDEVRLL